MLLAEDRPFGGGSLERFLTLCGFPVEVTGSVERTLALAEEVAPAPVVAVVDLTGGRAGADALSEGVRRLRLGRSVRLVGVDRLDRVEPGHYRSLDLTAVVDVNALPEELVFRLNEAVRDVAEARRFIRVFTQIAVACSTDGRELSGTITNLGKGGAFVQCDEPLARGDTCVLRFELPSGAIVGRGRVAFRTEREPIGGSVRLSGFGVELTEVEGDGSERLGRFVGERQSEWRALLAGP